MGLAKTLLFIAIIFGLVYYGYTNLKIDTMTICVNPEKNTTTITCVENNDCVRYMTSPYGMYSDSEMSQFIISQTTSCNTGKCITSTWEKKDICSPGQMPIVYKVTLQEMIMR